MKKSSTVSLKKKPEAELVDQANDEVSPTEESLDEETIVITGENIFAALGLPNAEERHAKTKLAIRIGNILKEQKLTQTRAAKMIGMSQSDVSNIVSGRTSGFTLERLLNVVNQFGYDIDIVVSAKPKTDEIGHTLIKFTG